MTQTTQIELCAIGDNQVCYKNLLGLAVAFRTMAYTQIMEQQQDTLSNQPNLNNTDLILSQFSSIYNSPDI